MNFSIKYRISAIVLLAVFSVSCLVAQTVTPWLTTGDKTILLQPQTALTFSTTAGAASATVTLNQAVTYQNVDGFGFSLTEGSAEVINSLALAQKNTLLTELFSKTSGLGLSVIRISIGASDLGSSNYSYNENSGDVSMSKFSLAGPDLTYLIPVLKSALAINPDIKILATPWTAPRWMKTNTAWVGGSLNTAYYAAYANYFVKYLDAMKAQGINIWAITPQNEPENGGNEPSMSMTSTEQLNFINNNLGPAMKNAGYSAVKIIAFDHNCDNTTYPTYVCNNSTYVDGAAFHLYGGSISALTTVKNATNKNVYFTEQYTASTGSFSGDLGWHMQNVVIGGVNNWAKTIIEWNLANNASFGPHTSGGCTDCMGAITVNNSAAYTRNVSYYIIGHVSKFIKTGAVRLNTSLSGSNLAATGFKNPDGSMAVLIYNSKSSSQSVKLVVGVQSVVYSIPAVSAVTLVWNPAPNAVENPVVNKVSLKPNPGKNQVKLSLNDNTDRYRSVSFYSSTGSEVLSKEFSGMSTEYSINVEMLPQGVYLVKVRSDKAYYYNKFIKQ